MTATARDIAKACGTSLSAVSRAFKFNGSIDPELRRAILAEAAERGYRPPVRRAREMRKSVAFGIVVGDIENPFYPLALRRFSSASALLGWDMTTFVVPTQGGSDSVMAQVLAADLDVLVLASAEMSSTLASECHERGLPVLFFNRMQVGGTITAVCSDNYGGGALAAERLISTGRTHFAFVGGRKETSTHLERRRGFIDTLEGAGQTLAQDTIGAFEYDTAFQVGRDLFKASDPPDGVFCASDNMGFAIIDAAFEAGLKPGKNVSVIGYDDVPMASWHRYQLTTISQQVDEMVARTVSLMQRDANASRPRGIIEIIPAKLIERMSG
jgi:DNA-binding LacI/PurR family transcriptional regulator